MLSKMPIVGAVIVRADDMNEGPVAVGMNAEAPPSSMMIKDGVIEKTGFLANLRPENEDFSCKLPLRLTAFELQYFCADRT